MFALSSRYREMENGIGWKEPTFCQRGSKSKCLDLSGCGFSGTDTINHIYNSAKTGTGYMYAGLKALTIRRGINNNPKKKGG